MNNWQEWSARAASVNPVFRGNIIENAKRFRFHGDGYKSMPADQDGVFYIETARQLAGPLAALFHPGVRWVHIAGAVQCLKSFLGDLWVPFVLEFLRLPMIVYFEDNEKADLYCAMRLMETLRKHPFISKMFQDALKENRHSLTGTWVRTLFSQLLVCGLNEGNTSTLSWPLMWISEGWLGRPGMLKRARKRTDRFASTCKVLNESQCSLAGSDFHNSVRDAFQVPLTWACPSCGGRQTFEKDDWFHRRPSDFKPRAQKPYYGNGIEIVPEAPKPGTSAGMRWPEDKLGKMRLEDRAAQAYWECIHCGHHIEDTPAIRDQVARSYQQIFWKGDPHPENVNLMPTAKEVCFTLPFEANVTNKFADTVLSLLKAERDKDAGNDVTYQDWFLSERAFFYEPGISMAIELSPVAGGYNPDNIPDYHSTNMFVDVQKALDAGPDEDRMGSFWVTIHTWNMRGDSFQVFRGFITSFEDLMVLKKERKIPNSRFIIDGRKWTRDILDLAARHYEVVMKTVVVAGKQIGNPYPAKECWKVFMGDDSPYFKWNIGTEKAMARTYSKPNPHQIIIQGQNGQKIAVIVYVYLWSNYSIKKQVQRMLFDITNKAPGCLQMHVLEHSQLNETTRSKETGDLTWDKQLNSEYETLRRGKKIFERKPQRQTHYLDDVCMEHCFKQMNGMAGGFLDVQSEVTTAPADAETVPA